MRSIHFAWLIEVRVMRTQHIQIISRRLQLAITRRFACRTDMIAFHEQHLHQRLAVTVEFGRIVCHYHILRSRHGAGGHVAAIDAYHAQLATAVWLELRIVA